MGHILALLVAGCSATQKIVGDGRTYSAGSEFKEAPMLARQVEDGNLPPLDQRLPEHPLVAKHDYVGYEGPGVYGGTWHSFHTTADFSTWKMVAGYAPLIRWRFDCAGLEPGLAESWEFNEDGTELTLHLRKGLRWSDGHPYTSESFAYWYRLCRDKRHRYSPPVWCRVQGREMTVETPDDYTIVMKFSGPNWLAPLWLATGYWWCDEYNIPTHYMQQFDPDFNPAYQDFITFEKKDLTHQNPERPSLWPWVLAAREKGGHRLVFSRNPYYYVVDELGRQLPYIDEVQSALVPDPQVRALRLLAGQVDCMFRNLELRDLALYVRGAERGGYRIFQWKTASGADPAVLVNWSPPDLVLRDLIRDQRFRKALALAVDREKCNAIAWKGLLQPQAATISQESWHFQDAEGQALFDQWKRADAEYDPVEANALLDAMGLRQRDPAGYRLRPDGRRLTLLMDVPSSGLNAQENDVGVIVAENWRALGIDTVLHTPSATELELRRTLGDYTISTFGAAEMDLFTYPDWVFPTTPRYWHPLEGRWYESGGSRGEPPTGPLRKLVALYDRIKSEKDLQRRHQYVREAVRIHIEAGPFMLGTTGRRPELVLVADDFHNVPREGILGPWAMAQPATSYPEQYYISEESP
ncbi:MAG: ABC transporter substrate-binding protein [Candidatus Hydrogenedentes bacterium]|nr:ABC transporter substrate-binding protein [Candidatus Hydrogenedentota bacterium]